MSHRRTVYLLAYYHSHTELFKLIKREFPSDINVKLKLVYYLIPRSLFCSFHRPESISFEKLNQITEPYRKQILCSNPKQNTPAWNARIEHRAIQWYNLFLKELRDVDILVVWGGFTIPLAAALTAARELGKKTLICENGVLAGTIAIDPEGVNYTSSLSRKTPEFYRSIPIGDDLDDLFHTVWPQRPLRNAVPKSHINAADDDKPLPERYLLYAMQVYDDSQIRLFSPYYSSMFESVRYVYNQMMEYNEKFGDDLRLMVKEHPSDYGRIDYTELRETLPGTMFLRNTPVREAIKGSLAVITINSSVAVEAMFYGLPVVTLGLAFFNVPGLVNHLTPDDSLADTLPMLLSEPVDNELRKHFLYYLWKYYLIPHPCKTSDGAKKGADRIIETMRS